MTSKYIYIYIYICYYYRLFPIYIYIYIYIYMLLLYVIPNIYIYMYIYIYMLLSYVIPNIYIYIYMHVIINFCLWNRVLLLSLSPHYASKSKLYFLHNTMIMTFCSLVKTTHTQIEKNFTRSNCRDFVSTSRRINARANLKFAAWRMYLYTHIY